MFAGGAFAGTSALRLATPAAVGPVEKTLLGCSLNAERRAVGVAGFFAAA
jgi:hypothetical protein